MSCLQISKYTLFRFSGCRNSLKMSAFSSYIKNHNVYMEVLECIDNFLFIRTRIQTLVDDRMLWIKLGCGISLNGFFQTETAHRFLGFLDVCRILKTGIKHFLYSVPLGVRLAWVKGSVRQISNSQFSAKHLRITVFFEKISLCRMFLGLRKSVKSLSCKSFFDSLISGLLPSRKSGVWKTDLNISPQNLKMILSCTFEFFDKIQ